MLFIIAKVWLVVYLLWHWITLCIVIQVKFLEWKQRRRMRKRMRRPGGREVLSRQPSPRSGPAAQNAGTELTPNRPSNRKAFKTFQKISFDASSSLPPPGTTVRIITHQILIAS